MTYRDLIDIPEIPFVPFEERFRTPPPAAAERPWMTPPTKKDGPRYKGGRRPAEPKPLAELKHRDFACKGKWSKVSVNRFGHQVVQCWRCRATRIARREA